MISCSCVDCLQIRQGTHPDFSILAPIEDRDIGIDAIRGLITETCAYPAMAPFRVFLIDGADRLTASAANAFLKTLEEPPERTRFFLLAENADNVIPTIRSRCGLVRYRRLSESFVQSVVQRYEGDTTKALVYSRMGEGSVGRSVRLCSAGRLTLRDKVVDLLRTGLEKDLARSFAVVELLEKDLPLTIRFIGQVTHDVLMLSCDPSRVINQDIVETLEQFRKQASDQVWQELRSKLHIILARSQVTPVNLPFHLKTLLVEVFGI